MTEDQWKELGHQIRWWVDDNYSDPSLWFIVPFLVAFAVTLICYFTGHLRCAEITMGTGLTILLILNIPERFNPLVPVIDRLLKASSRSDIERLSRALRHHPKGHGMVVIYYHVTNQEGPYLALVTFEGEKPVVYLVLSTPMLDDPELATLCKNRLAPQINAIIKSNGYEPYLLLEDQVTKKTKWIKLSKESNWASELSEYTRNDISPVEDALRQLTDLSVLPLSLGTEMEQALEKVEPKDGEKELVWNHAFESWTRLEPETSGGKLVGAAIAGAFLLGVPAGWLTGQVLGLPSNVVLLSLITSIGVGVYGAIWWSRRRHHKIMLGYRKEILEARKSLEPMIPLRIVIRSEFITRRHSHGGMGPTGIYVESIVLGILIEESETNRIICALETWKENKSDLLHVCKKILPALLRGATSVCVWSLRSRLLGADYEDEGGEVERTLVDRIEVSHPLDSAGLLALIRETWKKAEQEMRGYGESFLD